MHFLPDILIRHLYLALFLWVAIDQLGVPIPSVPVLLTVGTLSATNKGGQNHVSMTLALFLVIAACIAADSLWYVLGRRYGSRVLEFLCKISFESSTCINKTQAYFSNRGGVTLVIAKFVPGLGSVAPPIAGQTGMSYGMFLLWDTLGSLIWAATFLVGGRFFGDIAERSAPLFHFLGHFAFALLVAMIVGLLIYRVVQKRKFLAEVDAMRVEPSVVMKLLDEAAKTGEQPPYIVDLRHPLDYLPDPRVLPGAARIGPADLAAHADTIPRDRDVILYCTCPSEETSAKVAMQLHKLGINRVRPLKGGFDGWKAAGYPLEEFIPIS